MSNLRELSVSIGIDVDDDPLKELNEMFKDVDDALNSLDISSITRLERETGSLSNEFNDLGLEIRETDIRLDELGSDSIREMEREVNNSESAFGKLKTGILAIGTAVAAAFAIDKIKDFGLSAIEAAASGQARDAQFGSVFGEMEAGATESLGKISQTTGMYENRLKGTFTQIAAFAKTTGADTASALALSERATLAAADSAAFYDKSIEESAESLQSFLKGNFENDAALGISATEFTRNAKAAELFGKKFNDLTEYQKQDTLLKMVEDGNKLSGALGQASKESDTWENQMGNLRSAWEGFLEKAGTPILANVVDTVTILASKLSSIDPGPFMEIVSNGFGKVVNFKNTIVETFGILKDVFNGNGLGAADAMTLYGKLGIPPEVVEGIANFGTEVRAAFSFAKETVSQFVNEVIIPLMPVAQEYIGTAFSYIKSIVEGATNIFGTVKSAVQGLVENVIVPLMPVAQGVIETVFKVISPILDLAGSLFKTIASIVSFLVQDIIVPLLPIAAAAIKGAWETMKPVLDAIAKAFDVIVGSIQSVIDKIGGATEALKNFNVGDKISGAMNWVSENVLGFSSGIGRVPYDMVAEIHKDEAIIPAKEAQMLRDLGVINGDGRYPDVSLDSLRGGEGSYQTTKNTNNSSIVHAPVSIIVQGGNTNDETVFNIREAMEDFFADLGAVMPQVREG